MELFLWKDSEGADPKKLKEELADVLMYALLLADKHGLDIKQIVEDKIKRNNEKYPVEKAKGTAKKNLSEQGVFTKGTDITISC